MIAGKSNTPTFHKAVTSTTEKFRAFSQAKDGQSAKKRSTYRTYLLLMFIYGGIQSLPSSLISEFIEQLDIDSANDVQWIFAMRSLGFGMGTLFVGIYLDMFHNTHWFQIFTNIAAIAPLFFLQSTHNFALALFFWLVIGFATGTAQVSVPVYIWRMYATSAGSRYTSTGVACGCGASLVPLLIQLSIYFFHDYSYSLYLIIVLLLICTVLLMIYESPKYSKTKTNVDKIKASTMVYLLRLQQTKDQLKDDLAKAVLRHTFRSSNKYNTTNTTSNSNSNSDTVTNVAPVKLNLAIPSSNQLPLLTLSSTPDNMTPFNKTEDNNSTNNNNEKNFVWAHTSLYQSTDRMKNQTNANSDQPKKKVAFNTEISFTATDNDTIFSNNKAVSNDQLRLPHTERSPSPVLSSTSMKVQNHRSSLGFRSISSFFNISIKDSTASIQNRMSSSKIISKNEKMNIFCVEEIEQQAVVVSDFCNPVLVSQINSTNNNCGLNDMFRKTQSENIHRNIRTLLKHNTSIREYEESYHQSVLHLYVSTEHEREQSSQQKLQHPPTIVENPEPESIETLQKLETMLLEVDIHSLIRPPAMNRSSSRSNISIIYDGNDKTSSSNIITQHKNKIETEIQTIEESAFSEYYLSPQSTLDIIEEKNETCKDFTNHVNFESATLKNPTLFFIADDDDDQYWFPIEKSIRGMLFWSSYRENIQSKQRKSDKSHKVLGIVNEEYMDNVEQHNDDRSTTDIYKIEHKRNVTKAILRRSSTNMKVLKNALKRVKYKQEIVLVGSLLLWMYNGWQAILLTNVVNYVTLYANSTGINLGIEQGRYLIAVYNFSKYISRLILLVTFFSIDRKFIVTNVTLIHLILLLIPSVIILSGGYIDTSGAVLYSSFCLFGVFGACVQTSIFAVCQRIQPLSGFVASIFLFSQCLANGMAPYLSAKSIEYEPYMYITYLGSIPVLFLVVWLIIMRLVHLYHKKRNILSDVTDTGISK